MAEELESYRTKMGQDLSKCIGGAGVFEGWGGGFDGESAGGVVVAKRKDYVLPDYGPPR